jgi:hypothetical protein
MLNQSAENSHHKKTQKEVYTLQTKKLCLFFFLFILSCQVSPISNINIKEEAIKTIKTENKKLSQSQEKIESLPRKQISESLCQNVKQENKTPNRQTLKKKDKTEKTASPTKSVNRAKKLNHLENGIKLIIKEIEEPVGRNQSQAQVEALLLQKAKRLAVEEAGTYISSFQVLEQGHITKNQVNALASGILQAEIVGTPEVRTQNGIIYIKVKSRIRVDTSVVSRQVEALMKNKSMMTKLLKQQELIKELESQISALKQSDIKRLESLNAQAIAIEKDRAKQRQFLEQQRLAALKAIKQAQLKQIKREKVLNEKLQLILKTQESERKKEQEAIEREQDRIKRARLENESALQELARKAQISQASWQPFDQRLSAQHAKEETINLRNEIANVLKSIDDQYHKSLLNLKEAFDKQIQYSRPDLPTTPSPREMFETTDEYHNRMANFEEKVQKEQQKHNQQIDIIQKEHFLYTIQLKKEWLLHKKKFYLLFLNA